MVPSGILFQRLPSYRHVPKIIGVLDTVDIIPSGQSPRRFTFTASDGLEYRMLVKDKVVNTAHVA